jgi:hypothetical protein
MKIRLITTVSLILLTFIMGVDSVATSEPGPTQQRLAQRPQRVEYAGSLSYGDWVDNVIQPELPVHLWEFEGSAGDVVTITMNALEEELDPFLMLLSLNDEQFEFFLSLSEPEVESLEQAAEELGVLLAVNDDWGDSTNSFIDSFRLPANGRYIIVATSCCTAGSAGDYELILDLIAAPTEEPRGGIGIEFPEDNTPFIPPTTRVIDAELSARYLLEMSSDGETIVFSDEIEAALGRPFSENDVLTLEPTDMAPYGLLRRIVGIDYPPGEIVLETVQASLEEAIFNGTVHARIVLTPDGGFVVESKPDAVLARRNALAAGNVIPIPLGEIEVIPGVTASGTIELEPSFEFDMVIEQFDLKYLVIKNTTLQRGEITLEAKAAFSDSEEIELQPLGEFAPVAVAVIDTSFTIWLTPELTLYLGVGGSAEAAVKVTVNQEVTYDVGFTYENDQYYWRAESYGEEVSVDKPVITTQAKARAYLKPKLAMVILGGTGPYIGAEGYMRFVADPCEDPWWTLTGGVSGLVGAKLEIFSFDIADEDWTIAQEEWPLDNAQEASPVPCLNQGGSSGNGNGNGNGNGDGDGGGFSGLVIAAFIGAVVWYIFGRSRE